MQDSAGMQKISATRAIVTSIAVSIGDIALNLFLAVISGSTVMLAQALQGTADLTTASLLMIGVRNSKRTPDARHPFGFGREVFFWALLASVFALVVTGGLAILRGVQQIADPSELSNTTWAIVVLVFGLATNGYSLSVSVRRLLAGAKRHTILDYLLHSSLVETKASLLVDLMGTLSAALGLMALVLYRLTGNAVFDGIGAAGVGVLTAIGALFLLYNLRGFIVGISPSQDTIERIRSLAMGFREVQDVLDLRAVTIGSGQIFVILELHFQDELSTNQLERSIDDIKARLQDELPTIARVQIEVETPASELKVA